jgi:hypothetical protein
MNFKLTSGIGDAIVCKPFILTLYQNEKIGIYLDKKQISLFRNDKFYSFNESFLKFIFYENFFEIHSNEIDLNVQNVFDFRNEPTIKKFENIDTSTDLKTINDEFIIINTKIRNIEIIYYNEIKNQLIDEIGGLKNRYKIVLMGEKVVEPNRENEVHVGSIFSIYSDLKSLCDYDYTIDGYGVSEPNFNLLKSAINFYDNAKYTLNFGSGGNVWISSLRGNTINYIPDEMFLELANRLKVGTSIKNFQNFVEKIRSL